MSTSSSIEWTQATWNPTTGCDRVSPGCDHCYALTLARRLKALGSPKYQTDGNPATSGPGFAVTLHPQTLDLPRTWQTGRRVFVNSMSDLFHAHVPVDFIQSVFTVMSETPQHTYQILTKRSLRLARLAPTLTWPANVWIGVSVETTHQVGRLDHLRRVPASLRFLSAEPLLGPLTPGLDLDGIGWVITGGESGPHARPINPDWVRAIRDTCQHQQVPFFHKQWGGRTPKATGRHLDGRPWDQYPRAGEHRVPVPTHLSAAAATGTAPASPAYPEGTSA
jgi:protein gp37